MNDIEPSSNLLEGSTPLVTCDEVAEVGRVTVRAVEAACRRGRIKATKVGRSWRIPRRAALKYLGLAD